MALWIKFLQASAEHPDRLPANVQCALVRGPVNAQRQPAGDDKTGPRQTLRKRRSGVQSRP